MCSTYFSIQSEVINWQENTVTFVNRLFSLLKDLLYHQKPTANNIVYLCDLADSTSNLPIDNFIIRLWRSLLLTSILQENRQEYIEISSFLANRIPRADFPNVQNIAYPAAQLGVRVGDPKDSSLSIVDDCVLPKISYTESVFDKTLLSIFRYLVQKEINFKSPKDGIEG